MNKPPEIYPESIMPAPQNVAALTMRRCVDQPRGCGQLVRIDRFVALKDGDGRCWKCIHRSRARKTHTERAAKAEMVARQLLSATAGKAINSPHISEVCAEMMQTFGTVGEFARAWKVEFDKACAVEGGTRKTVLDAFSGISKLVALSTQHRATAPDVLDMDREDMVEELVAIFLKEDKKKLLKLINPEDVEEDDDDRAAQSA